MKKLWIWIIFTLGLVAGLFFFFRRGAGEADEIQYRYAPVERSELIRSTSATGVLVAQTSIDVRSKAGGTIVQLAVDAGSIVKKGDLIAVIDPRDTRALYDQALADVQSANSRIASANANYRLQSATAVTSVEDARVALRQAEIRLEKARIAAKQAPTTVRSGQRSSQASYEQAVLDYDRYVKITAPQLRKDVEGQVRQSKAALDSAEADLERQRNLLARGYVAQSVVDASIARFEAARSSYETALQRQSNLNIEIQTQEQTLQLAMKRAEANLSLSRSQEADIDTAVKNLREAEAAVQLARVNLQKALDGRINVDVRRADLTNAQASAQRSRVGLSDALVQLQSTTVVAPRDGVVTIKYAEEGTVIPAGVSQFSDRANIVQISDVTRMYVDCTVDEADISSIREGQTVRVVTEAYPTEKLSGKVSRVNPSALTANSITSITVRVELDPIANSKIRLLPGMNASCEFITLSKPKALVLPSQAVKREGEETYVLVKGTDEKKPVKKVIKVGESGNDGIEVLEGLSENEEVVVAEINLRQLREMQQRMIEAQQGGGLAGGGQRGMGGGGSRPTGGGGGGTGGGGRPSGGGTR